MGRSSGDRLLYQLTIAAANPKTMPIWAVGQEKAEACEGISCRWPFHAGERGEQRPGIEQLKGPPETTPVS